MFMGLDRVLELVLVTRAARGEPPVKRTFVRAARRSGRRGVARRKGGRTRAGSG